jgi:hypothetical protein
VSKVLAALPNHGSEEGLTPVLGHALMQQSFTDKDLSVRFSYRQLNKSTEEPHAGADGGFLVRVQNADTTVQKAALFQAKLLRGEGNVRQLTMWSAEAQRLKDQVADMLKQTDQAVAVFYTSKQIYVVDAAGYHSRNTLAARHPLSEEHRLITLGTYLGRWIPRCTKGDERPEFNARVQHQDGFRNGITMKVVSQRPSISWFKDPIEIAWTSGKRRK